MDTADQMGGMMEMMMITPRRPGGVMRVSTSLMKSAVRLTDGCWDESRRTCECCRRCRRTEDDRDIKNTPKKIMAGCRGSVPRLAGMNREDWPKNAVVR